MCPRAFRWHAERALMAKETILVVDDEDDIRELLKYNLEREGYTVTAVATGEDALRTARSKVPNLIVLDLMLPGVDGLDVCKILKNDPRTSHIPIMMVTAKGDEADIVTGLEVGADDYVTKPFSPRVLIARIRAVLRKKAMVVAGDRSSIRIHDIVIDPARHQVLVKGKPVQLTATEFRILHVLARRPGWVLTRYQIVDAVHGQNYPVTDRSVDVQIAGLRKELGQAGKHIQTVRGVGYRFEE